MMIRSSSRFFMAVYNQKVKKKVANMCNFSTKLDVSCFHYYFSNRLHFHSFVCIFMYHIWKKSHFPIATKLYSILKEMHPWELVEHRSIKRNTLYKRLNVILLPTWTFQNYSASRERPLTLFRYTHSLSHFKMKEIDFS